MAPQPPAVQRSEGRWREAAGSPPENARPFCPADSRGVPHLDRATPAAAVILLPPFFSAGDGTCAAAPSRHARDEDCRAVSSAWRIAFAFCGRSGISPLVNHKNAAVIDA